MRRKRSRGLPASGRDLLVLFGSGDESATADSSSAFSLSPYVILSEAKNPLFIGRRRHSYLPKGVPFRDAFFCSPHFVILNEVKNPLFSLACLPADLSPEARRT